MTMTSSSTTQEFRSPRKAVLTPSQLTSFQESTTYKSIVSYIEALNESVVDVKLTDACVESDVSDTSGSSRSLSFSFHFIFLRCGFLY